MDSKKKSWTQLLFTYAESERKKMILSVILSVLSVTLGLAPFYCMYKVICLFTAGTVTAEAIIKWCLTALLFYAAKILTFSLSTGTSHSMAYTVLESLRLADRFLHAPLGNVENHSIGEIKNMMVDKIENLEPPQRPHSAKNSSISCRLDTTPRRARPENGFRAEKSSAYPLHVRYLKMHRLLFSTRQQRA